MYKILFIFILSNVLHLNTYSADGSPVPVIKKKAISYLPKDYKSLDACKKQDILWTHIEKSSHAKLPRYNNLNILKVIAMYIQGVSKKNEHNSDVVPRGWTKYLHRRGAVSKVKIVAAKDSIYTGIFKGAECALLRLSLTSKPKEEGRAVAPGLALKVLRNNNDSANISALYSLSGQGHNYNFFTNSLSNIVPIGDSAGEKLIHSIFKEVSEYPEQLALQDMASVGSGGESPETIISPRHIFFVPTSQVSNTFSTKEHEIREDFLSIKQGTSIYKIYAVPTKYKDFNYFDYNSEKREEFLRASEFIAEIITESEFIASEFGDTKIFFKHESAD